MASRPPASSHAARPDAPAPNRPKPPPPPLAAVEWRAASPSGEQLGPTVPTVFAQWIRTGQIEPNWLVWRSDWPDWRTAAEAAAELPAPLIGAPPAVEREPAAAGAAASTVAAFAVEAARQPPPNEYARRRRRSKRRQMTVVLGLAAVAAGMLGMLVYLMFKG